MIVKSLMEMQMSSLSMHQCTRSHTCACYVMRTNGPPWLQVIFRRDLLSGCGCHTYSVIKSCQVDLQRTYNQLKSKLLLKSDYEWLFLFVCFGEGCEGLIRLQYIGHFYPPLALHDCCELTSCLPWGYSSQLALDMIKCTDLYIGETHHAWFL